MIALPSRYLPSSLILVLLHSVHNPAWQLARVPYMESLHANLTPPLTCLKLVFPPARLAVAPFESAAELCATGHDCHSALVTLVHDSGQNHENGHGRDSGHATAGSACSGCFVRNVPCGKLRR